MSHRYVGSELELFSAAKNWKTYVASVLSRFIGGTVLEVGAGIGSNITYLHSGRVCEWTSLEPDPDLAGRIEQARAAGALPPGLRVVTGTIDSIDTAARFDTILYLDVLEHIADDRTEMEKAASRVADGGCLIVLAPAHQFLFSPFDAAIGHHRRYTTAALQALTPPECRLEFCRMLDSAGFFASLANRLLLRSADPTQAQVQVWDKALVPISRRLDRHLRYRFGKSVLAVWRRTPPSVPVGRES